MRQFGRLWVVLALSAGVTSGAPGAEAQGCGGDCDGDGALSVSEILTGRGIALEDARLSACPAVDFDGDGGVNVAEVTRATAALLSDCAAQPPALPRIAGVVMVLVGATGGTPGTLVPVGVSLDTGGLAVTAIQVDIAFDPLTPIAATAGGRPSCTVNPDIDKGGTAYAFRPSGCAGAACTGMRALVLALDNVDPIPDGALLFTCNVRIDAAAPDAVYPLLASNAGSSDPNGIAQTAIGVDGSVSVGPPPVCGDGVATADEQCDDGNTDGGDGCALNCTLEVTRVLRLDPARSRATVQTEAIPIPLALSGEIEVIAGQSRPSDAARVVPLVSRVDGVRIAPIRITGLVCGCVRGVAGGGTDVWARGAIGCAANGLTNIDYRLIQDHNTTPGSPGNRSVGTPDDADCADQATLPGGAVSRACLEGVDAACSAPSSQHIDVCNGPQVLTASGGAAPAGAAFLASRLSITLLRDHGACSTAGPPTGRPCAFPDYGPDCLPCTDDDLGSATVAAGPLTSGVAEAAVFDANNNGSDPQDAVVIDKDLSCFGVPCLTQVVGAPFACSALAAGTPGDLSSGSLVTALPAIDAALIGDSVVTLALVSRDSSPPPTPTATRTPTRTPTRVPTVPPTPTVAAIAPGSLILERARLHADGSDRPGVDRGGVRLSAVVNANPPFGSITDQIAAGGATLRARTAAGVDVTITWVAADCSVRASARGPRVTCAEDLDDTRRRLRLRPLGTPNLFALDVDARGLAITGPLSSDPIHVDLVTAAGRREDDIGACVVRGARGQVEYCHEVGVQPTATMPPTPTQTPSLTATRTRTATPVRSPTFTATHSATPTVTGTPTPLFVPSVPLGIRAFAVAPGELLATDMSTGTGLFTTALGDANAANSFSPGPLLLAGGLPGPDGVASLALAADALLDVSIVDGSRLCLKLVADGSSGSVDCDGGTPYGVTASAAAGPGQPVTLQTGLGAPLGPGHATLIVRQFVQPVPVGNTTSCAALAYGVPAGTAAYTTGTARATKGPLTLTTPGQAFNCGLWQTARSGGRLAFPLPDAQPLVGDVANAIRLSE